MISTSGENALKYFMAGNEKLTEDRTEDRVAPILREIYDSPLESDLRMRQICSPQPL